MIKNVSNRNSACPCGSGKRFKHCCGSEKNALSASALHSSQEAELGDLLNRALSAQTGKDFARAETLYRAALNIEPRHFDALHMLGVVQLQTGNSEEACRLLVSAFPLKPDEYPPYYQNLGLAIAAVAKARGICQMSYQGNLLAHRHFLRRRVLPSLPAVLPKVSIVAPCYNHERYVTEAIASIAQQTYQNLEFIVIDDGSRDGSVAAIQSALSGFSFPHRFIHRENQGAHATLNEAIGMATGSYIGILNTDDRYIPERVDLMIRSLLASEARWGFSNLSYIDETGDAIQFGSQPRVDALMKFHDRLYGCRTVSEDFSQHNIAVTTGNLFFEKTFWQELGGFEEYRYNHDWAFCLGAIMISEPVYLDEPAYIYRLHGANTIKENIELARQEADQILGRWYRKISTAGAISNPVFAAVKTNRWQEDLGTMGQGAAHLLNRNTLIEAAIDLGFTPSMW